LPCARRCLASAAPFSLRFASGIPTSFHIIPHPRFFMPPDGLSKPIYAPLSGRFGPIPHSKRFAHSRWLLCARHVLVSGGLLSALYTIQKLAQAPCARLASGAFGSRPGWVRRAFFCGVDPFWMVALNAFVLATRNKK
jgi:hypothetical protein